MPLRTMLSFLGTGGPGGEAGRGLGNSLSLAWAMLDMSHLRNIQEEMSRRRCPWDSAEGLSGDSRKPQQQALTTTARRAQA